MDTYEKKYNEALNWMRELYPGLHGATKEDAEHYFPELRESEDERIRKALINIVKGACSRYGIKYRGDEITEEMLLTYLEKQKGLDKMIVVSPEVWDNAISDAFENGKKEGEKQKDQAPKCTAYLDLSSNEFEACMLRYLQSAANRKDDAMIMIDTKGYAAQLMKIAKKEQKPRDYCSVRDEFDLDGNHLPRSTLCVLMRRYIQLRIPLATYPSLLILVGIYPLRASADDKLLDFWLDVIDRNDWRMDEDFCKASREFINRLKSLRPKPHWKPSDEQMEHLKRCFSHGKPHLPMPNQHVLESLHNDLKKLM